MKCIENLANKTSVPQSLDLIRLIIGTYPEKKAWKKDSKRSIIENLESQYQLLSKFFSTLEVIRKNSNETPLLTINVDIQYEIDWQKHQLSFLDFILHNSPLSLSKQQIEM